MCTLYTFSRSIESTMFAQIAGDSRCNDDGYSMVLVRGTDIVFRGQFTEFRDFLRAFAFVDYDRAFVHLRASTTATQGIPGCHMFSDPSRRYIFCHNGILKAGNEAGYPVDSQWLGEFLEHDQIPDCDEYYEDFANFIVIDAFKGKFAGYAVNRTGNLYTDGNGNYSTYKPASHWRYAPHGWTQHGTELTEIVPDDETAEKLKSQRRSVVRGYYCGAWDDDGWTYRPQTTDRSKWERITPDPLAPPFDSEDSKITDENFICEGCNEDCHRSQNAGLTIGNFCKKCYELWYSELEDWKDNATKIEGVSDADYVD